jgi:hypothetical protein
VASTSRRDLPRSHAATVRGREEVDRAPHIDSTKICFPVSPLLILHLSLQPPQLLSSSVFFLAISEHSVLAIALEILFPTIISYSTLLSSHYPRTEANCML